MSELNDNEQVENNNMKNIEKWDELNLDDNILRGIYAYGFENPSEIQKKAILPIIQGQDVIAQAQSGTGKTGTFSISALQKINVNENNTQIIILTPTHELCTQIYSVISSIGMYIPELTIKTLIGGTSVQDDISYLKNKKPHIIIGCTGRVLDMINRKLISLNYIKLFILDEADEMLSKGFVDHIQSICGILNKDTQTAIFSATMPRDMFQITKKFMNNPISITLKREELSLEGIEQYFIALNNDQHKYETLKDLFETLTISQSIIYTNNVKRVEDLYTTMIKDGFPVCCIHSSMDKDTRNSSFNDFKNGKFRVLISSNITARGIDIQQVGTVINFDIPTDVHSYLHRIGRSGRWGRKGLAINFITREDVNIMKKIENFYKININEYTI